MGRGREERERRGERIGKANKISPLPQTQIIASG